MERDQASRVIVTFPALPSPDRLPRSALEGRYYRMGHSLLSHAPDHQVPLSRPLPWNLVACCNARSLKVGLDPHPFSLPSLPSLYLDLRPPPLSAVRWPSSAVWPVVETRAFRSDDCSWYSAPFSSRQRPCVTPPGERHHQPSPHLADPQRRLTPQTCARTAPAHHYTALHCTALPLVAR